jgi:hypothetical protein
MAAATKPVSAVRQLASCQSEAQQPYYRPAQPQQLDLKHAPDVSSYLLWSDVCKHCKSWNLESNRPTVPDDWQQIFDFWQSSSYGGPSCRFKKTEMGAKLTCHPPSSAKIKNGWKYLPRSLYMFVTCVMKHRGGKTKFFISFLRGYRPLSFWNVTEYISGVI